MVESKIQNAEKSKKEICPFFEERIEKDDR